MAKLKSETITQNDIEEYLARFSDFSFEIKTLSLLTSLGYDCRHSGTYTDPITKKIREFDIRAIASKKLSDRLNLDLLLAIECKNLRNNFPLVVHCVPRTKSEEREEMIFSYRNEIEEMMEGLLSAKKVDVPMYNAITIPLHRTLSIYRRDEPVGKSCDQIGRAVSGEITGSDSDVFEKISQAINSSFDLVNKAVQSDYALSIIKPVLVVPDGALWQIIYDNDGKVTFGPTQVDFVPYYYGKTWPYKDCKRVGEYTISHLDIVTFRYLQQHLQNVLAFESVDLIDDLKRKQEGGMIPEDPPYAATAHITTYGGNRG